MSDGTIEGAFVAPIGLMRSCAPTSPENAATAEIGGKRPRAIYDRHFSFALGLRVAGHEEHFSVDTTSCSHVRVIE